MVDTPTKEELKYWESVLHYHRLGMGRGRSSKVDYVGGEEDVRVAEHNELARVRGRRVRPSGAKS